MLLIICSITELMGIDTNMDSTSEFKSRIQNLTERLTSITTQTELQDKGYLILDNALDEQLSASMRQELSDLHDSNMMRPNEVQFSTTSGPVRFEKPNIYEADLHEDKMLAAVPTIGNIFLGDDLSKCFTDNFNTLIGQDNKTVKLQVNTGNGGCFPWHYDNPGPPNNRAITLLIYLNRDWKDGDGGEVYLQPFLSNPIKISPKFNRVVVFLSNRILHKVSPSNAIRYLITLWIDGTKTNDSDNLNLKMKHLSLDQSNLSALSSSPIQRCLFRSVYGQNCELSLLDCFKTNKQAFQYMLAVHRGHVKQFNSTAKVAEFVEKLKEIVADHEEVIDYNG